MTTPNVNPGNITERARTVEGGNMKGGEITVKLEVTFRFWVKPAMAIAQFMFFLVGKYGAKIKATKGIGDAN